MVTAFLVVGITSSYYLFAYQPGLYPFRKADGTDDQTALAQYRSNPIDKAFLRWLAKCLPRRPEERNGSRLEKALIKVSAIMVYANVDIDSVEVRPEHE